MNAWRAGDNVVAKVAAYHLLHTGPAGGKRPGVTVEGDCNSSAESDLCNCHLAICNMVMCEEQMRGQCGKVVAVAKPYANMCTNIVFQRCKFVLHYNHSN